MKYFVFFLVLIGITFSIVPQIHAQLDDKSDPDLIFGNFGAIHWMDRMYHITDPGTVRVIDSDMNLDSNKVDSFDVDVWSKSDAKGITLAITETGTATGIFEGTVFFTTAEESSGHKLRVAEGDWVTVKYKDNTLPFSYTLASSLDISSNSKIKITQLPPLKQHESNVPLERIQCNRELVLVQKEGSGNPACVKFESIPRLIERGWIQEKSLFDPKIMVEDILMQYDESYSKATLAISLEVVNPNNVTVTIDGVNVVLGRHDIHFKNEMDSSKLDIPAYSSKSLDVSFEFAVDRYFNSSVISDMSEGKPGFNAHGTVGFDSERGVLEVGFDIFGTEFMRT